MDFLGFSYFYSTPRYHLTTEYSKFSTVSQFYLRLLKKCLFWIEGVVGVSLWGFKSPLPHHDKKKGWQILPPFLLCSSKVLLAQRCREFPYFPSPTGAFLPV